MRTRSFHLLAALALAAASALPAAAQTGAPSADAVTAFVDVTVLPMDGDRVLPRQTVLVRGDRITAVGPAASTRVPAGATRIDGRGKFLMPGLVEMHGHMVPGEGRPEDGAGRQMALLLANGVTTIRGLLAPPGYLAVRDRARRGEILAPTILVAGPSLNGQSVSSPAVGAVMVREAKSAGFDWLKMHGGITREAYDTIVAVAARERIPLSGHVSQGFGLARALQARQQVEHLDGYIAELMRPGVTRPDDQVIVDETVLAAVDETRLDSLARATAAAGVCNGATMALFRNVVGDDQPEILAARPEMRYASPAAVNQWTAQKRQFSAQAPAAGARRYLALRDRILLALHRAGALIVASSDSPQFFLVPGFAVHRELEALVGAGMPAHAALRAGTANAAACLGQAEDFGTVAVGKRADLLLLDADPLQQVANAQKIGGVMVRGRWLPAAELKRMLDAVATTVRPAAD